MILIGVPLADCKAYSVPDALGAINPMDYPGCVVAISLETEDTTHPRWAPLWDRVADLRAMGMTVWTMHWWDWYRLDDPNPRHARVRLIVRARNMIRAQGRGFTHVFYLDSDVVPPEDALRRLLALDSPLAAGVVRSHDPRCPGIPYVFTRELDGVPGNHYVRDLPVAGVYRPDFVTAGFLLVRQDVLACVEWRGPAPCGDDFWGEDPLFCFDAYDAGFGTPVVDCGLVARHHSSEGSWV